MKIDEMLYLNSPYWRLWLGEQWEDLLTLCESNPDVLESQFWLIFHGESHQQLIQWKDSPDPHRRFLGFYFLYWKHRDNLEALMEFFQEIPNCCTFMQTLFYTRFGHLYTWMGRLKEAETCLNEAQQILESTSLPTEVNSLLSMRLFAEFAQNQRHMGKFSNALSLISRAKVRIVGDPCIPTAWISTIRIGILSETITECKDRKRLDDTRKIMARELATIEKILKQSHSNRITEIVTMYQQVAQYKYYKSSIRNRDRVAAQIIIEDIIKHPLHHWISKIDAKQHLIDLLIHEYKLYEQEEVKNEILSYLDSAEQVAVEHGSILFLIKIRINKAKLAEIEGNFNLAQRIYDRTLELTEQKNLGMLRKLIIQERERFTNDVLDMQDLITRNARISERMRLTEVDRYLHYAMSIRDIDTMANDKNTDIQS